MDAATTELLSHPLFSVLSDAARRELGKAAQRRRVRRAEIVYAAGGPGDATYLIRRGRVKVSRLSSDGREITICLCHPGELFGEESLVLDAARVCQAQALEECSLFALPQTLLLHLMRAEAAFAMELARLMGQRREQAEDQIEDLAFRDVGARLARLLITLAARQGSARESSPTVLDVRLTHQELANCVGTTRETLTLTIDRFRADDWIRFEGRMIVLHDIDALRARAGDGRPPRDA